VQHRRVVTFHDPDDAALRNLGDALNRALLEVGACDEADFFTATTAHSDRVRHGEFGEGSGVPAHVLWGIEPAQVDIERRLVVDRQHTSAAAACDEHGVPDAAPA